MRFYMKYKLDKEFGLKFSQNLIRPSPIIFKREKRREYPKYKYFNRCD